MISPSVTASSATTAAPEFAYSYAACENLYEDYEKVEEGTDSPSPEETVVQSTTGTMRSIYEVEQIEDDCTETDLTQSVPSTSNDTSTIKIPNPTYVKGGKTNTSDRNFQTAPNTQNIQQQGGVCDYWTELDERVIDAEDNDNHSYTECDSPTGLITDDEYEPISPEPTLPKAKQQTNVADYWTEVLDEFDHDNHDYTECDDENGASDDSDYEPIASPDETTANDDANRSYEECDSPTGLNDTDDITDDTDYENVNSPVGTVNRNGVFSY